jgi:hypothetical protein
MYVDGHYSALQVAHANITNLLAGCGVLPFTNGGHSSAVYGAHNCDPHVRGMELCAIHTHFIRANPATKFQLLPHAKVFHWLKDILCSRFSMIDLGEVECILGLQVTRDRSQRSIMLGQHNYIARVLTKFEMDACKPITTPLDPGARFSKSRSPSSAEEKHSIQEGCRMYCMVGTRLNIAATIGIVAQSFNNRGLLQW